jgi:hypothetical protein
MKSLYLHTHLGLGDHIICNAIVRYFTKLYDRVYLFVFTRNLNDVAYMFRDLKNIKFLKIDSGEYSAQFKVVESYRILDPNMNYLRIGYEYLQRPNKTPDLTAEQFFYEQVGLPWQERYNGFHIERNKEEEEKVYTYYNPKHEPYVFVHHDPHRNRAIDFKYILNKNIKVVEFNGKITDPHPFRLFDHMKLIENAEECHVIDSSFKCLADSFLKDKKNMFFHRYTNFFGGVAREWTTSNKFWTILDEEE